ncbi:MAG: alpha/beta hydrolase [Chloroflexi bacterium]|nr:alpha/beta hydrolase [Chloroflexota bacterium]
MSRRILTRVGLILVIVLAIAVAGFVVWAGTPAGAVMEEALAALESSEAVSVSTEPWLTFTPAEPAGTGLVFYPGGRVLPEAYAPAARALAEAGYLVVIPAMPLNLAVFAPSTAKAVIAAHPEIDAWVIGGHSLGGAMAANFAHANPDAVQGVVLWASFPQASDTLAGSGLVVASIYGTLDGLASVDDIDASRPYLPDGTAFVAIDGGNHAQFGYYGPQGGDLEATISREEQQAQVVTATLAVLAQVSGTPE